MNINHDGSRVVFPITMHREGEDSVELTCPADLASTLEDFDSTCDSDGIRLVDASGSSVEVLIRNTHLIYIGIR